MMRIDDNDIERDFRDARLANLASLERAASMVESDELVIKTIHVLKTRCIENDLRPNSASVLILLDRSERLAGDIAVPSEFRATLKDAAIQEAEYERALRYKQQSED